MRKQEGLQERAPPWPVFALSAADRAEQPSDLLGGSVVKTQLPMQETQGAAPELGRSHVPRGDGACAPQLTEPPAPDSPSSHQEATAVRGPHAAAREDALPTTTRENDHAAAREDALPTTTRENPVWPPRPNVVFGHTYLDLI